MRTGGFPHPIIGTDWAALAERYADAPSIVQPVTEVVLSISRSPVHRDLLYSTSMWDLLVTTAPATPPPVDAVVVRASIGMGTVTAGRVVVEHLPLVGTADSIERDGTDAVPLFWRFMIEKYGVHPDH